MVRSVRLLGIFLSFLLLASATVPALHAQSDGPIAVVDDTAPSVVDVVADPQPADARPVVDPPRSDVVAPAFPAPRTKTAGCLSLGGLPDAACTPGAVDPRVTQDTIGSTICTSGYTAKVRPRTSITNRIKVQQMAAYGLQDEPMTAVELDHLIPLELGGAPADVANLWPEPWTGESNAHEKDAVETHLKRQVCSGAVSLAEAQRLIATDWSAIYRSESLQPAP